MQQVILLLSAVTCAAAVLVWLALPRGSAEEERDEEREDRIARGSGGGPVGMTFYIFEPGTNRYSSYRVFGNQITSFYPVN